MVALAPAGHAKNALFRFFRDWGVQLPPGINSAPILPLVVPVVQVDDCTELLARTRPEFSGKGTMAATAAVYGLVGLRAGDLPLIVHAMADFGISGDRSTDVIYAATDLRTANTTPSTALTSLLRGAGAATASILQGTTTVATHDGFVMSDGVAGADGYRPTSLAGLPMLLRPGEGLWLYCGTVNKAVDAAFRWRELAYALPPNPESMT